MTQILLQTIKNVSDIHAAYLCSDMDCSLIVLSVDICKTT